MQAKLSQVACVLCENDYGRYAVPSSSLHRPVSKRLLKGGVWEPEILAFIKDKCGSRSIVHAGMFFGDFLPAISSFLADGARAYCFEPNPESFRCAQWTAVLNNIQNVDMFDVGLGDRQREVRLRTSLNGMAMGGCSRIVGDRINAIANEVLHPIEVVALDEIIPEKADIGIIQLDVEGYERFALAGAMSVVARCRPTIILETPPPHFIEKRLCPMGYRLIAKVCENSILVSTSL